MSLSQNALLKMEITAMQMLENNLYDDFDKFLIENTALQRHRLGTHLRAKKFLFQENYKKAILQLKLAQENYGQYIGVGLDMITCYYCTGNFFHLEEELNKITNELGHFVSKLSRRNLVRTYIFIGKMYEELCLLTEAYNYYQLALQYAVEIEEKIKILSQLLRFCAIYKKNEVAKYFDTLAKINSDLITEHLYIEVLHANILARFELLSFDQAINYFHQAFKQKIGKSDKALIYFDVLEIILRLKDNQKKQIIQETKVLATTPFEKALLDLPNEFSEVNLLNKAEKLRLLYHCSDKTHYYLILSSLSSANLKIWQSAFEINLKGEEEKIVFHEQKLIYLNKICDLRKKQGAIDIIKLFNEKNTFTCDDNNYHQLRVAISRLNKMLQTSLSIGTVFSINGKLITLNVPIVFSEKGLNEKH
jgi:hypothetical protein